MNLYQVAVSVIEVGERGGHGEVISRRCRPIAPFQIQAIDAEDATAKVLDMWCRPCEPMPCVVGFVVDDANPTDFAIVDSR